MEFAWRDWESDKIRQLWVRPKIEEWKQARCLLYNFISKIEAVFNVQWNLYKAEPHGIENIFHIEQISALYKINNTDSSGRDYRISSHWANFRLIKVPPYTSFTVSVDVCALRVVTL
jgi:hypothetical protein